MEEKNTLDKIISIFDSNGLLSKALYSEVFSKYLDYEIRNKFFWLFGDEHCATIINTIQDQCNTQYAIDTNLIDSIEGIKIELEQRFDSADEHNNWKTAYYIICKLQGIYEIFRSIIQLEKTTEVLLQKDYYTKSNDITERYINRMYHGYLDFISLLDAVCLKYAIDIDNVDLFKGCSCADNREYRDTTKIIKYIGGQNSYNRFILDVMRTDDFLEKCAQAERFEETDLFKVVKRITENFSKEETEYFKKDIEGYFRAKLEQEFYPQLRAYFGLDRESLEKESDLLGQDFDNYLYQNELNTENKWLSEALSRFYNYKTIIDILHKFHTEKESIEKAITSKGKCFSDYLHCDPCVKEKAIKLLTQDKIKPKTIATILLALYKLKYLVLQNGERNKIIKAFYDEYKIQIDYNKTLASLQNGINEHIKRKLEATISIQATIKDEDISVYTSQLK